MKKALKLALVYLIILIVGIVLGTLLYSLYLNLLSFIAGRDIAFFKDAELFQSLFFVMPCMLIFIMPVISYYRIRHPGGIFQLIVYILLCLVTWVLLMPCTLKLKSFCSSRFTFEAEREYLSPDYFRKTGDDVYYFTREFESPAPGSVAEAPAIVIDTSEYGKVSSRMLGDYPGFALNKKALPYREIQLKNIFDSDDNPIPIDFQLLIFKITNAYSGGLRQLLLLFSLALIIGSLYAMTNFFDWRLLNAVMIFISMAIILSINSIYYTPVFDTLKAKIMDNGIFRALNEVVSEPILFILNCFFALLYIICGIVKFALRKHAKKAR